MTDDDLVTGILFLLLLLSDQDLYFSHLYVSSKLYRLFLKSVLLGNFLGESEI